MEFYSSQGPSLFPSIFHITDIKLTYFPWGADGWDCWQNVEQKAGKKNSQDGSCTKCNRKRSREGRWDHPQHGAVNSFALMSIPGSETKQWCDRWCDGTGLGFETFVRSEGFTEWKSGAARVPGVHRQWQWHRFQRAPPWGNAAAKVRLSSSQSKAEPAWHLGRLWLSEMTFFKTDTFPLVTSTGAQERRGHLLPQDSLAPAAQRWLKVSFRSTCWPLEQLGKVSLPLVLLCWIDHSTHTFSFLSSP